MTCDWLSTERLTYEVDVEPKSQIVAAPGHPRCVNVDPTPSVAYAAAGWLDVLGELTTGYTNQTANKNAFDATARAGLQFSILSRVIKPHIAARRGTRRILVAAARPGRDRLPVQPPEADDGRRRLSLGRRRGVHCRSPAPATPVASTDPGLRRRLRIDRASPGGFEALFIWTGTRNAGDSGFTVASQVFDVRIKRMF